MSNREESKKNNYCVYIHTSPSNKRYIGITSMNPKERWKNGRGYNHNKHFTNAIEKYGWDNFKHEILAENLTEQEACKMEAELIEKYNTFDSDYGYNHTTGGEIGKQHTNEVRRKQSELAKKMWEDEEYRAKMHEVAISRTGENNPNYGNHKLAGENHPNWGKKLKPETIEKMKNRKVSEETRKKISKAAKARMTPEYIERIREARLGFKHSKESKEKMSKSQKDRWNDELRAEWSEKFSGENNGMYGKHHSEETKQKLREMFSGENSVWYGKHHTEESKQKLHDAMNWKVPVVKLTLQGEFVEEFDSYAMAAKSVGGSPSPIIGCCVGYNKSAYGYMWVKKESYNPDNVKTYKNNKHRSVVQLNKDWTYVNTYNNLHEAEKIVKGHHQNIHRVCKNKGIYLHKGFRWMYEEDYIKFIEEKENENGIRKEE